MADADGGVCGGEAPPMVGDRLTGTGLTLEEAAERLARGEDLPLTELQRRMVERWVESR